MGQVIGKGMPHGGGLRTYTIHREGRHMGDKRDRDGLGGVLITDVTESRAMNPNKDYPKRNACLRTQIRRKGKQFSCGLKNELQHIALHIGPFLINR